MPDDLSCCPGADIKWKKTSHGGYYENNGNCMRKSDAPLIIGMAREAYKKCTDPANKDTCDAYLIGQCPYWRVYRGSGYVYNGMDDGEENCACTADDMKAGSARPQCRKSGEYGPDSGYLHHSDCSKCGAHGRTYLAYNGRGNRMPDINENYGCDGANTTYDEHCDFWYVWSHCKDLEDGKVVGEGLTSTQAKPTLAEMLAAEITAEECGASQRVGAMKMYLASPEYKSDFPVAAAATDKKEEVSELSKCRLEAMAALMVWLITVRQ
jgi:hypothetical protein